MTAVMTSYVSHSFDTISLFEDMLIYLNLKKISWLMDMDIFFLI
jgi:DNA-directed RNA polymerase alpha subunit